jgi:serine protease AprX
MDADPRDDRPIPAEFRADEQWAEPSESTRLPTGRNPNFVFTSPELVVDSVLTRPLIDLMAQEPERPLGVVIELRGGVPDAMERLQVLIHELDPGAPITVTGSYVTTALPAEAIRRLVELDAQTDDDPQRPVPADPLSSARAPRGAVYRIWPNFQVGGLAIRSIVATKCQAAHRSFNATGRGLVWAVLDSGIQGDHAHFERHRNLARMPHRSFLTGGSAADQDPMVDESGHGTHVAGILAGEQTLDEDKDPLVAATWYQDDRGETRPVAQTFHIIMGMAPQCELLSCKVLRADTTGDITALLAALAYIQELNDDGRNLQVHGVNISVGHPFDPSWFAAGLTPVCREVDRLVRSGVVVVVAAGNTGFGYARDQFNRRMRLGFDTTINDPGNAELAITVGSTSCAPHLGGVSYFSSKGPTGDGRMKPDLVAPGERVISAAAGKLAGRARSFPGATYVENSGTSMAAPHVSGAAAGFLSVHREFIGRPDRVKAALLGSATDIGRSPHFQGAGMLDAMRAIQSV